jgi:hypothetical protein
MVDSALRQATETIQTHRADLERLVALLLEKETVDTADVVALLGPPVRSASDNVITAAEAEAVAESASAALDDQSVSSVES